MIIYICLKSFYLINMGFIYNFINWYIFCKKRLYEQGTICIKFNYMQVVKRYAAYLGVYCFHNLICFLYLSIINWFIHYIWPLKCDHIYVLINSTWRSQLKHAIEIKICRSGNERILAAVTIMVS